MFSRATDRNEMTKRGKGRMVNGNQIDMEVLKEGSVNRVQGSRARHRGHTQSSATIAESREGTYTALNDRITTPVSDSRPQIRETQKQAQRGSIHKSHSSFCTLYNSTMLNTSSIGLQNPHSNALLIKDQKSPTAASKTSSEGVSSLAEVESTVTSIEEHKSDVQLDFQNMKTDLYETATAKGVYLEGQPNVSSIKRVSPDGDNFKVSIPLDDSLVHVSEDLSTTHTTSSEETTAIHQAETSINDGSTYKPTTSTHSYRLLAEPTLRRSLSIDPLNPLEPANTQFKEAIPPPHSEPAFNNESSTRVQTALKNKTYPRMSTGNIENVNRLDSSKRHNTMPEGAMSAIVANGKTNRTLVNRRTFQSINTIKIPDNYQRIEIAKVNGADHGHHHLLRHRVSQSHGKINANGTDDDLEHPKRHRVSKTASFLNGSRIKSKMKADEQYNIPGQQISLKHENYAVVYDLVTGIRFSVSRCSKLPAKITDSQFTEVTKLLFNREGNSLAPPTKYEFKFKDYAPEVFRDLRRMFNVNQADYLMSLNDEIGVRAVGSSGKSGSSFYYSNDRKFIIKTIHRSEHRHLRRILKAYYNYVKANPNTLLCQFYGLHRLKMATRTGTVKVHVLVMNNLIPPTVNISELYDLKGSTYGRATSEKKRMEGSCMKDLNFLENKTKIYLSKTKKNELENQLTKDISLLKKLNIMDYSLLLGLRHINSMEDVIVDERTRKLSLIQHQEVPGAHKNTLLDTDGGIRAIGNNGEPLELVYYVGVIDCLTNYNTLKRLETFFRSLKHRRETISAVPPSEYGDRFLKFIFSSIETPGDSNSKLKKVSDKFKSLKKLTKTA